MTHPLVQRRRAEREQRLGTAAAWAKQLARRLDVSAVVVFGSVARGDFNKWSDLDVLVIAPRLPDAGLERLELLMADAPPGVQPVGWTPAELAERRGRGDPIAVECDTVGVTVHGTVPTRV